jgi:murein DD-endopeptidase MepM/ murein hydrolase activator NlpD
VQLSNPLPDGRITARWGGMKDPWNGDDVFHKGVDVASASGTPVLAPAPGVVLVATEDYEPSPASGTVIIVDHGDGLQTMYAHLGSLAVADGDSVARGQLLARVGSTGKSTGPHLHFEVRRNGEPRDPADFVADWR